MWSPRTAAASGLPATFTQDNQSFSRGGVLRGMHYQVGQPQAKLIRVVSGRVFDVAVDLRRTSATYGQHVTVELASPSPDDDAEVHCLWIPEGFAHGFLVLSESAELLYKTTGAYFPAGDRTLLWNDPTVAIPWPIAPGELPILSAKDKVGQSWADAEKF